jgi:hypothetical protein
VLCSCREASDATCISRIRCYRLKNFHGRQLTLTLNKNIPQYGCEKMKICSIIEISHFLGTSEILELGSKPIFIKGLKGAGSFDRLKPLINRKLPVNSVDQRRIPHCNTSSIV